MFYICLHGMNGLRKFSLKYFSTRALLSIILFAVTWNSIAQRTQVKEFDSPLTKKTDTIKPRVAPSPISQDTINISDTIPVTDSIPRQEK